jgi:hypothetical protein
MPFRRMGAILPASAAAPRQCARAAAMRREQAGGTVLHRLMPAALLLVAMAISACGSAGPALTDPDEIITQGLAATGEATSLHLAVAVTGSITIPQTGGTFNLEGTTAAGDFDIAKDRARLTFKVPAFLSLSGEVIQVGTDSFVKTSLTGDLYTKSTTTDTGVPVDPVAAISQVGDFLDKEGVESEKLDDVSCGDQTCYSVSLTIPSSLLGSAGAAAGVDASQFLGETLVINLQFDRETLRLTQVSSDIDAGDAGTFGVVVTISGYNAAVEVSPPPSDQVTEGGSPQL